MGNTQPRIKLHYVKEDNQKVTGLVQFLDVEKGTTIPSIKIYLVGREKTSFFARLLLHTIKDDHVFFRKVIELKVPEGDMEPTFEIDLPDDLPPSGHGGNYKSGLGYAIGYHVMAEAGGNTDISDIIDDITIPLWKIAEPSGEFDKGSMKFCGRTMEYEIPKKMPRGRTAELKFRFTDEGQSQNARIRLREVGTLLTGSEQAKSEIKYEIEETGIAATKDNEWTVINLPVTKFCNTEREGKVLNIKHVIEMTGIGTDLADFINIPVTLA